MNLKLLLANPQTTFYGLAPYFGGILSALVGVATLLHIPVPGVAAVNNPWELIGGGLMAVSTGMAAFKAKDAGTHSTIAEVEKSTAQASAASAPAVPPKV